MLPVWGHDAEVQKEKRGDREQCDHLGNVTKRLISEDIIKSNILAGWGSLGALVLLMPSLIAIIAFTAELILLLVPRWCLPQGFRRLD